MALWNRKRDVLPDSEPAEMQTVDRNPSTTFGGPPPFRAREAIEGVENPDILAMAEADAASQPSGLGTYTLNMLNQPSKVIGKEQIAEAMGILQKYKNAKAMLEARIVEEEDFYMLQYYKRVKKAKNQDVNGDTPNSAWLFNSLHNKHADMMDSYPTTHCLPRERSDEEEAKALTSILPVIYEQNNFEKVYSDAAWYKLKHGVSAYSVLWNPEKDNGLGDIEIGRPDILKLFWDMSVTDIQQSPHFFSVDLINNDALESQYPELQGKLGQSNFQVIEYRHNGGNSELNVEKSLVVDWYYKKKVRGIDVVHYCKFCGDTVLYASENETDTASTGFYEHGKYPFVFDVLFPEEGTAIGFGIIAIGRDPQTYIDLLDKSVIEYALKSSKPRWIASEGTGINEQEWLDWNKPIVHLQGQGKITEEHMREITLPQMPAIVYNYRDAKIDELKEGTSNRDFSQGSTGQGVTSGAAIATLQEAGNKTTRDTLKGTYGAYEGLSYIVIEDIRQFYTEERSFRIKAPNEQGYDFVTYNNLRLQMQPQFTQTADGVQIPLLDEAGNQMVRKPIIDIKVEAQKQSPFTTLSQNETAMNLYSAGFFNPELAQQALICLDMMDFEGKEKIVEKVREGQTLQNMVMQMQQQIMTASQMIAAGGLNPAQFGLQPIMPEGAMPGDVGGVSNGVMQAMDNARAFRDYEKTLREKARV